MAVINTLKELLESKERTRYWLWKRSGLAQNTVYRLHDDPKYIPGGDVMDAVCEALEVQPGEWLKWIPKEREMTASPQSLKTSSKSKKRLL